MLMKTKQHGELEMEVMDILWNSGHGTVNDVLNIIGKNRQIAYTTVATIMQRLFDKGLLTRKQEKSYYVYLPQLSKADYSKKIIKNFLHNITHTFGHGALTSFAESIDSLPKKKKQDLLKLLQEYKSE